MFLNQQSFVNKYNYILIKTLLYQSFA